MEIEFKVEMEIEKENELSKNNFVLRLNGEGKVAVVEVKG